MSRTSCINNQHAAGTAGFQVCRRAVVVEREIESKIWDQKQSEMKSLVHLLDPIFLTEVFAPSYAYPTALKEERQKKRPPSTTLARGSHTPLNSGEAFGVRLSFLALLVRCGCFESKACAVGCIMVPRPEPRLHPVRNES